ncbi:MAG: tRNA (adenosine(37)-N6)-threonylcarbamoyltransferase complex ATPase subunit type 1 TsaE [Anaerolineales bacterium]
MDGVGWEVLVGSSTLTYNPAWPMPILDDRSLEFLSHSPEQTRRLGVRLGELLKPGDVICLAGDLGSGKTTMAQGIARGWGALDPVTSPTFVIVNEYRRADGAALYHVDAFRLHDAAEAEAAALREQLEDHGPVLVEWPERIQAVIPMERIWITLTWVEEFRRGLRMEANGPRYERLLRSFRKVAFGG